MGAKVHLPCVNHSEYLAVLEGKTIYMGFAYLQGIEQRFVECIVAERKARGPFADLEDFKARVPYHKEQLVLLIRGGAFGFTKRPKAELLWQAFAPRHCERSEAIHLSSIVDCFVADAPRNDEVELPELKTSPLQNAYDEIELYGFPVTMSWFDLLETKFRGELMAVQMLRFVGRRFRMLGKLVTIKYVHTCKGDPMAMATFVDATGESFDTVHFPQAYKAYPFQGDGVYLLLGVVTEEFGQPSLQVEKMAKMPYKPRK